MAEKGSKNRNKEDRRKMNASNDSSKRYAKDFLTLRNAIVENCRDCIRDCGKDCLDKEARPIENIRCPLQKVRIDYGIAIKEGGHDLQRWRQANSENIVLE